VNQKELERFKEKIIKMRDEVLNSKQEDRRKETYRETSGDHTYSYHIADQGSDCMENEKSFLFASLEGNVLDDLNDALMRIDNKTFGTCFMCGKDISIKRLEAVPSAKLCIDCKSGEEKEQI